MALFSVALMAAGMMVTQGAQAAGPFPQFLRFCKSGGLGGQCSTPRSVATDPTTGHIFLVEEDNSRVQEFTAWGEFVKAFGWGVVASGPSNDPRNEIQRLTVDATGGSFALRYGVNILQTDPLPFNASSAEIESALITASFFEAKDPFEPGDLLVSGPSGGPWDLEFVGQYADSDFGSGGFALEPLGAGLTGGGESATLATVQQGGNYEICLPEQGDVCRAGSPGSSPGQLGTGAGDRGPQGIAVDSEGDVYVVDRANHRIQKFDADGSFSLMFGDEVNKTTGDDVCTRADISGGDTCGAGLFGSPGPGEGQFSSWEVSGAPVIGDYIDVGSDDTVYVGDNGRIQKFSRGGEFLAQITGALAGQVPQSLVVNSSGQIYVTLAGPLADLFSQANIRKLDAAGVELSSIAVSNPRALALDSAGNVFATTETPSSAQVLGFTSSGTPIDLDPEAAGNGLGGDALARATGLAVTSPPACGLPGNTIIVGNAVSTNSFVNIYGPAPNPNVCTQPLGSPTIVSQFATSVTSSDATVKARINPHFWPDTRYRVQFGVGKCSDGDCSSEQPAPPGALLTSDVIDAEIFSAGVFLTGLQPGTTYSYRFVAESSGGPPAVGPEQSFRTPIAATEGPVCPNESVRSGLSRRLPDCRGYELVSPIDKANGDISSALFGFAAASPSGDRATFSSLRAFANPKAAPFSNQYLSTRSGDGWMVESISSPRGVPSLYPPTEGLPSLFKVFSSDLCSAWEIADTEVTLTPGSPRGVPNLYRRDNCSGGSHELLTSTTPPGFGPIPYETYYFPTPQGFSEDGKRAVFRANAALAVASGEPRPPFVCTAVSNEGALSYQWLRNGAPINGASGSTYTSGPADDGTTVQCEVTSTTPGGSSLTTGEALVVGPIGTPAPPTPGVRPPDGARLLGAPEISGDPRQGATLTCSPGLWLGSPSFTYQWYRNAVPISGATTATYLVVAADKSASIQCRTIGGNAGGSAVADSERVVVSASPPLSSAAPQVSGTPAVGETLTCAPGTWTGSPSFSYLWLANGAQIGGATASTYTVAAGDAGKAIQCRVLATNPDGGVVAVSNPLVVAPPPATAPPELSAPGEVTGDREIGATLTCNPGSWSGSPTFAYRWLRNGVPITPVGIANKSTYTPAEPADVDKALQCQVTATNAGGAVTATSGTGTGMAYVPSEPPPPGPSVTMKGNFQLYIHDGSALRPVSVLPDGTMSTASSSVGTAWSLNFGVNGREDSVLHAVSDDGSRVFWTAKQFLGPGDSGDGPGTLYLRLNATAEQSAVSGGNCTEPAKACTITVAAGPSSFIAADPSGNRVIYRTGDALFEASIEDGGGGQLVATADPIADPITGVMGTSEDANRIYFVSTEVLSGGQENSEGDAAVEGGRNLYLYEQGEGMTFVATLGPEESQLSDGLVGWGPSVIALVPNRRASRVTADGLHAAFISTRSLTGYDNVDVESGDPDAEVFLFDADANSGAGQLVCASCNPTGARPEGRELWVSPDQGKLRLRAAAMLPVWGTQFRQDGALSQDGSRLYFDVFDGLVSGDSNGKGDVYQWEAVGTGSCTEASSAFSVANGGCLSLISSGGGGGDAEFLDATPDGSSVFFNSQANLLPQDTGSRDVYVARVNGGFPPAPPPAAGCEGEGCQSPPPAPPAPTPTSQTFQGSGNPKQPQTKPKRCPKGKHKVKRHGKTRCVKNNKGGKSRKGRSAKAKGANR